MGNGLLAFAAGLGSGYLGAQQRNKEQERLDRLDAQAAELYNMKVSEYARVNKERVSLMDAGKLATVNPDGATLGMADGTQTVYDNAGVANSDFRQLRAADQTTGNQTLARVPLVVPPLPPGLGDGQIPKTAQVATPTASLADSQIAPGDPHAVDGEQPTTPEPKPSLASVMPGSTMPQAPQRAVTLNGKAYPSLADAKVAEAAYNDPDAIDKRIKQAIVLQGKPLEAKQYQAAASTEKANEFAMADSAWRRKLGKAMMTPGTTALSGLATLFTQSEFGPMAGKQVQDVPSADGKTVNISVVNSDGSLTPSAFNFSNDQDGVTRAAYMLDGSVTPEHRFTSYVADSKAKANAAKEDAKFDETKRHNMATEKSREITANAEATRAAAGPLPPAGYRKTASGDLEAIPGGPGDKIAINKPLNDAQSKALLFGSRMRESDVILNKLATAGTTTSIPGSRGSLGGLINVVSPENKQMLDQAKRDFTNAVLRRESGAVIADSEFANAEKQYFPQIGDSPKTIEQKSKNRKLALDGVLLEVPESHRNSLQPRSAGNTPLAMPKTITDMKPGSVYQTGRGPAKWNGTAFEGQ